MRLLGISGSLRKASYNTALLRAAAGLVPPGVQLEVATLHGIPLYDGDLEEASGIPAAVQTLKEKVVAADGLLLVTPEYNNSMPGVFKNAIDWLSRPPADALRVFGARPVGVIGASPGSFGTVLAQSAWLPVLRLLGTSLFTGARIQVVRAGNVFDAAGNLSDDALRGQLQKYLAGFVNFIRNRAPGA